MVFDIVALFFTIDVRFLVDVVATINSIQFEELFILFCIPNGEQRRTRDDVYIVTKLNEDARQTDDNE